MAGRDRASDCNAATADATLTFALFAAAKIATKKAVPPTQLNISFFATLSRQYPTPFSFSNKVCRLPFVGHQTAEHRRAVHPIEQRVNRSRFVGAAPVTRWLLMGTSIVKTGLSGHEVNGGSVLASRA